jgi:transcriptional regulator with XRE-family HTH domain
MDQQAFLRRARSDLGMPYRQLAAELGVSERTIEKWSLREDSADHRAMPLMAIRLILRLLDDRKRELLARGDRAAAEAIDALGVQVDPARLGASMRTFDALQRSFRRMAPMEAPRRKPRWFATPARKNAWERNEETRCARRAQAQASGKR